MKPTKNHVYCPACRHTKMLFETQKKADNFIKFNGEEIKSCSKYGKAPVRSYFCCMCAGWHVTSVQSLSIAQNLDSRDKAAIQQLSRVKRTMEDLKAIEREIVEINKLIDNGAFSESQMRVVKCEQSLWNMAYSKDCQAKVLKLRGQCHDIKAVIQAYFRLADEKDISCVVDEFKVIPCSIKPRVLNLLSKVFPELLRLPLSDEKHQFMIICDKFNDAINYLRQSLPSMALTKLEESKSDLEKMCLIYDNPKYKTKLGIVLRFITELKGYLSFLQNPNRKTQDFIANHHSICGLNGDNIIVNLLEAQCIAEQVCRVQDQVRKLYMERQTIQALELLQVEYEKLQESTLKTKFKATKKRLISELDALKMSMFCNNVSDDKSASDLKRNAVRDVKLHAISIMEEVAALYDDGHYSQARSMLADVSKIIQAVGVLDSDFVTISSMVKDWTVKIRETMHYANLWQVS